MTTLSDIRTRLRQDLGDADSLRWDDDALDRHIARALDTMHHPPITAVERIAVVR
jgi:hypothetical protein